MCTKIRNKGTDNYMCLRNLRNPGLLCTFALLLIIAIVGAWLVKINTPFGMGIFPDSVAYIMGARNILAGNGFSQFSGTNGLELITIWPPLYSYVLAFIGLIGMDPIRAARLLNIILMGLDLLLFAGLVYHETHNKLLSIISSLLFLFSIPLFLRYTWALTEPLFFTLLLLEIILYYLFLHTQRAIWVTVLGLGTALLFLTRYVGIFMTAIWIPSILLVSAPKTRIKNIVLYLLGLLPLIIVDLSWNYLLTRTTINRTFSLHVMTHDTSNLVLNLKVLEGWFTITGEGLASHTVSLFILCLLGFAFLAGLVFTGMKLYKRAGSAIKQPGKQAIFFPLILAMPVYVIIVLFTSFFSDSSAGADDRTLSPLWFFGLYLLLLIAHLIIQKGHIQRIVIFTCLLVILLLSFVKFQKVSEILRSDGQGFISEQWKHLPSIEYIQKTDHNMIYSNEPLMVYILTGKVTYQVPFTMIDKNKTYLENYRDYDIMRTRLIESDGILVLFAKRCSDISIEWIQLLTRDMHLIEQLSDTCIYSRNPR